jgi:hypothetical protein
VLRWRSLLEQPKMAPPAQARRGRAGAARAGDEDENSVRSEYSFEPSYDDLSIDSDKEQSRSYRRTVSGRTPLARPPLLPQRAGLGG